MIPFDKALFKAPNFSVFDMSHDNKLNMGLGSVVPIYWKYLHPNERITTEVGNLVRMQPLNGAILQHYDITFDSFFVPARLIFGRENAESFFNLYRSNGTDTWQHGGSIPRLPWDFLIKNSKSGTLLDYLGYPTFPNMRALVSKLATMQYWFSVADSSSVPGSLMDIPVSVYNRVSAVGANPAYDQYVILGVGAFHTLPTGSTASSSFEFNHENEVNGVPHATFASTLVPNSYFIWLLNKSGLMPKLDQRISDISPLQLFALEPWPNVEDALKKLSVSPEKSVEMYLDYLLDWCLSYSDSDSFSDFISGLQEDSDLAPSVAPVFAYWRIISDWFFNYNLSDMPEMELYDFIEGMAMPVSGSYNYSDLMDKNSGTITDFWYSWRNSYSPRTSGPSGGMMDCFRRNWANDYFTSAFRSPQSGNAVPLPSADNASIVDLRRANVLQEMYERVLYAGRKYRDQVRAFFSVVPANSRLDVVEVISREVQPLQISEVTQTNQADFDKMLETPFGAFGGQSQTVGSHKLCDYTSDEHGIFMVLASIRPKSAYFQGVRNELLKTDVFDFLWPQMENIGEQEVHTCEIFADMDVDRTGGSYMTDTFGWQRHYAEFMYHPSEVHGDLQNSLDYLHAARKFEHVPALNVNFGEIRPEDDDLNRVFVYSADERPFIIELYFDSKMIRPLSRYLSYDL